MTRSGCCVPLASPRASGSRSMRRPASSRAPTPPTQPIRPASASSRSCAGSSPGEIRWRGIAADGGARPAAGRPAGAGGAAGRRPEPEPPSRRPRPHPRRARGVARHRGGPAWFRRGSRRRGRGVPRRAARRRAHPPGRAATSARSSTTSASRRPARRAPATSPSSGTTRSGPEIIASICRRLRTSRALSGHLQGLALHHLRLGFLIHQRPLSRRAVYDYLVATEPVSADVTLLTVADRLAARGEGPLASPEMVEAHLDLAREMLRDALALASRWFAAAAGVGRRARR